MRNKTFTEKEDAIIIDCVKHSSTNLSRAFKNASNKLRDRSEASVSTRYYSNIRNNNVLMAIGNEHGLLVNTKNVRRNVKDFDSITLRDTMLKAGFDTLSKEKIIELFISDMTGEEKTKLLLKIVKNI